MLTILLIPVSLQAAMWQETLQERLKAVEPEQLAKRVMTSGSVERGALLYYQPELTCVRCHEPSKDGQPRLGPSLAEVNNDASIESLIESLLDPSKEISEDFQNETIVTSDGNQLNGLITEENTEQGFLVLTDPNQDGKQFRVELGDIEERRKSETSAMPNGLVGGLNDEQSFLDLVRYLVEIKKGGTKTVLQHRPPESFFAKPPLPEYEASIDHASMIKSLNEQSFERGQGIYAQYCARCHGTDDQEGTMPSALRFAEGAFKNGSDPHSMYETLTHGYGLMVAQRWMVPKQKYDVIHYIREKYLAKQNAEQHFNITNDYLVGLPIGNDFGPDPVERTPWSDMDYGNFLFNTVEVGDDGTNIAYKGIAVRLDEGPGGVSQGKHWILYEHDTMRVAAAWSGSGFIDYNGIHFNDRHNVHPRIVGDLHFRNAHRAGWANPVTNSFDNDPRLVGRDDKLYGPLPESWLKYRGLYQTGDRVVLSYTVGETEVLEMPSLAFAGDRPVFKRTFNIGPRTNSLILRVADTPDIKGPSGPHNKHTLALFWDQSRKVPSAAPSLDGASYLKATNNLDWNSPTTVIARIRTIKGGTIICQTNDGPEWVPGGKSLFVRDGRLVFDIGWVGAVTSKTVIDDGELHTVALVWNPDSSSAQLFVDGQLDQQDELEAGKPVEDPVTRIGFTAENFPSQSNFVGAIENLYVYSTAFSEKQIAEFDLQKPPETNLQSHWRILTDVKNETIDDLAASGNDAVWVLDKRIEASAFKDICVLARGMEHLKWEVHDGAACLVIPASDSNTNIEVNVTDVADAPNEGLRNFKVLADEIDKQTIANLSAFTAGSVNRFPDVLTSELQTQPHSEHDAFAVDFLHHPETNPWQCRYRLTGLDFVDENRAFVCSWDGSVWDVRGFAGENKTLSWRRIASGLFQPLGIRIIDEKVYVTCRDQIVLLRDLNNDGAFDYYHAFNSDHQVTEHFHEFAMGLQTDHDGNFYYAKSARHAKPALVPHHGTLIKVSADGKYSEILANGFRAANGVCLNPDGSFFVTDQEGHWNPKNRINWVQRGGFYGNMMGYHDVVDSSDKAMEQPLCWITNAFDRSPGELLWVPDDAWGSLGGSLLNLSYGMGQVFVVPHESVKIDGKDQLQGGMCALPIPLFPTGIMRGRFHTDGQLYGCGMYAWAGNQQEPGGFYRIRKLESADSQEERSAMLPISIHAADDTLTIEFSDELSDEVADANRFAIKTWNIHRTANYGSPHLDEKELEVTDVRLTKNRRAVQLTVAGLDSTRCMEVRCSLLNRQGRELLRTIHNTIHRVKFTESE